MPGPEDFTNELDGLPHLEELLHLPVLDGLGLLNQSLARKVMNQDKHFQRFARETADFLTRQSNQMASKAVGHRAWLDDIRSSNLSSAGVLPSVSTSV